MYIMHEVVYHVQQDYPDGLQIILYNSSLYGRTELYAINAQA